MRRHLKSLLAGLLAAVLALSVSGPPLLADEDERDHERALRAVARGEILPLTEILARAEEILRGRMIEAELERDDGRWFYELTLLGPEGRVVEALFDAETAELLELEGESLERMLKRGGAE